MLAPTTLEIVKSALRADPNVSPAERKRHLNYLRYGHPAAENQPAIVNGSTGPRVESFGEAAERSNRSVRSIHLLCSQGLLTKCKLPGRKRASGVLAADLDKLITASAQGVAISHADIWRG